MPQNRKLSERQRKFADILVNKPHLPQHEILKLAGYSPAKVSACQTFLRVKELPLVKAEIQKLRQQLSKENDIDSDRIIKELSKIAFSDISKVMTVGEDGTTKLLPSSDWPEDLRSAIVEISPGRVKTGDKLQALKIIAQVLGIIKPHSQSINAVIKNENAFGLGSMKTEELEKILED